MCESGFHRFIESWLPIGKTILELGSGAGSKWLVDRGYVVFSVEHDEEWLNKYDGVNYIYSPLKEHKRVRKFIPHVWYDPAYLKGLPGYDLLLIDGPPAYIGRVGFIKYRSLFNTEVPMVFDDVDRRMERLIIQRLSKSLGRPYYVDNMPYREGSPKKSAFGVILPTGWKWIPVREDNEGLR